MLKELVKLANHLDSKGLAKEADYIDNLVKNAGLWDKFKRSFREIVGLSNVSDCAKKCAGAMLMLGQPARNNNPDKCVRAGYEYTASVNEKVGILNSLIKLEKDKNWQEYNPKKVIEDYLKDTRHEVEFLTKVVKSETGDLLVSLFGLDIVSEIFMGTAGEALRQKVIKQRQTLADKPHHAARKGNCVNRTGHQIPCPAEA
jgi:hypothetical protein